MFLHLFDVSRVEIKGNCVRLNILSKGLHFDILVELLRLLVLLRLFQNLKESTHFLFRFLSLNLLNLLDLTFQKLNQFFVKILLILMYFRNNLIDLYHLSFGLLLVLLTSHFDGLDGSLDASEHGLVELATWATFH